MGIKILSLNEYTAINESFKSKTISNLFKNGEIEDNVHLKSILNQLSDNEIIGIADNEEDAKKMLHKTLGDKKVTKYHMHRTWHQVGPDDWEDDWEDDYASPYTYNRTVDGYKNWIFGLNSGKFLVLRIESDELSKRLRAITDPRYKNKESDNIESEIRKKFNERKKFAEQHKNDIKKYWEFKKFLEEQGLFDEFVNKTNDELKKCFSNIMGKKDFESDVCECEGEYYWDCDTIDFNIGNFKVYIYAEGVFEGNVRSWYYPATYDDPGDSGCEIEDGEIYANSISITLCKDVSDDDVLFDFYYIPEFDKKCELCNVYETY